MDQTIIVDIGRTTVLEVGLGFDVSGDVFTSEIRAGKNVNTPLLAAWTVTFLTDGTDGELVLTLDDAVTSSIARTNGYMDIKRMANGEPISVFEAPLPVIFQGVVTQ